jgi:DNA-binding HxlR family transcriptional regulator
MYCSIARTLDVVGEGWTLLILRDVLQGLRRFDELQKSLGIATNVLTARLKRLTELGLVERCAYHEHPPRFEYLPTEKATDLGPVLIGLLQWGDKHLAGPDGPPRRLVHAACGHTTRPELVCSECREPIGPRGVRLLGPLRAKAAG